RSTGGRPGKGADSAGDKEHGVRLDAGAEIRRGPPLFSNYRDFDFASNRVVDWHPALAKGNGVLTALGSPLLGAVLRFMFGEHAMIAHLQKAEASRRCASGSRFRNIRIPISFTAFVIVVGVFD